MKQTVSQSGKSLRWYSTINPATIILAVATILIFLSCSLSILDFYKVGAILGIPGLLAAFAADAIL